MTRTTTHFDKASEIHISEGEALRDFATVLARVRSGARIVIDSENSNRPRGSDLSTRKIDHFTWPAKPQDM
jgi:hypothetical protein